jgi:alkaline phosphatase
MRGIGTEESLMTKPQQILALGLSVFLVPGLMSAGPEAKPETKETFRARGRAEVEANARLRPDRRRARNVILFIGDGMGVATVTAARILDGQQHGMKGEENKLSFEKLPFLAHSKTYQANQQVSDSAPTMTSIVTGSKANDGSLSVAPNVLGDDFAAATRPENRLRTILEQAEERGLWTGVVSTARLTHATPGACYAHTPNRDIESDVDLAKISPQAVAAGYPDIAKQLLDFHVKDTQMKGKTSRGLELAFGGGRSKFLRATDPDPEYPGTFGERKDRNLAAEWTARGGAFVFDQKGFNAIDPATTGPVLGLFEPSHMQYELDRAKDRAGEPSLAEMTAKAIRILKRGPRGFFLMVEAGRIDHGHHAGNAARALNDTIELSRAVEQAVRLASDDTLIIVTADHSHTLFMNGYPTRGNPILGLVIGNDPATGRPETAPSKAQDGKPYTTLGYANGPGAVSGKDRPDLTGVDTAAPDFKQQSLIPMGGETHGGEDVAIYARGPHAYLFQGTMEENSIYWVMSKALGLW